MASPCDGTYQNKDKHQLDIRKSSRVTMSLAGTKAECKISEATGKRVTINCGPGVESAGTFSDDCSEITFNGVVYRRTGPPSASLRRRHDADAVAFETFQDDERLSSIRTAL